MSCFTVRHPTVRGQLKCDGTRAESRFRLSAKQTSPFKSAGAPIPSTNASRGVGISGSNAVKVTGYPLHSPVSPSLPLPCVTVFHHISTGVYLHIWCVLQFVLTALRVPLLHWIYFTPITRIGGTRTKDTFFQTGKEAFYF